MSNNTCKERPRAGRLRRTSRATALVATALLALGEAAIAAPAPGGVPQGDAQRTGQEASAGPTSPQVAWRIELPGHRFHGTASQTQRGTLDAAGHLLLVAANVETSDRVLFAIDRETGEVDWTVEGVHDPVCAPLATDDGKVFVLTNSDGLDGWINLLELDAATGETLRSSLYMERDAGSECLTWTLSADNDLIAFEKGQVPDTQTIGRWLTTIDTETLERRWTVDFGRSHLDPDQLVLSKDQATVFLAMTDGDHFNEDHPTRLFAVRASDGEVLASPTIDELGASSSARVWQLLGAADGDLIALWRQSGAGTLARYAFDGTSFRAEYSVDWARPSSDVADESGTGGWLNHVAYDANTDRMVGLEAGNGSAYVVDATGMPLATIPDWVPGETGPIHSRLVMDSRGVAYGMHFDGDYGAWDVSGRGIVGIGNRALWPTGTTASDNPDQLGPIDDAGRQFMWGQRSLVDGPVQVAAVESGTARLTGSLDAQPTDVAIQICKQLFPDGAARTIVLSRNDVFADALVGSPLAGRHGCVLFTEGGRDGSLDRNTAREIARALAEDGYVEILGGEAAISGAQHKELVEAGHQVRRWRGASRYETAAAIAREVAKRNPGVTQAYVAYGLNWPDAVGGSAAAAALGIPVLLTDRNVLPDATASALADLGIKETVILGGTGVISPAVAAKLPSPTRVSGPDRHATAAEVAKQLWGIDASSAADASKGTNFVITALRGETAWAYALGATPLAVANGAPLIGVESTSYPGATQSYLQGLGLGSPAGLVVPGPTTVVSDEVVKAIEVDAGR